MSIIQPSAIKAIALSVDVPKLTDEGAKALALDVDYRLREVVQDALKFAKHCKRMTLTVEDINLALRMRNAEPLYGLMDRDPGRFARAAGVPDLFYVRDRELTPAQLVEAPLPRAPRDVGVLAHWLAIDGQQPAIPENAPLPAHPAKRQRTDATAPASASARSASAGDGGAAGGEGLGAAVRASLAGPAEMVVAGAGSGGVAVRPPVRHVLSRELEVYFDKVVGLVEEGTATTATAAANGSLAAATAAAAAGDDAAPGSSALSAALASVASDPGLHPLAPYFSAYIANGVASGLANTRLLGRLLRLARALLSNPHLTLEPYLPQLLPAVSTVLLTRALGSDPRDAHRALRQQAAQLLAAIAASFGEAHHNVRPQLARLLGRTWLDPSKGLPSKYGAVVGLQALGADTVRQLLVPHLEPFVSTQLLPLLAGRGDTSATPDAWALHGALVEAVGRAMYARSVELAGAALMPRLRVDDGGDDARPGDAGASARGVRASQRSEGGDKRPDGGTDIAAVLAASWREDADFDATLGALLQLFGEALLAYLPLGQAPAYML